MPPSCLCAFFLTCVPCDLPAWLELAFPGPHSEENKATYVMYVRVGNPDLSEPRVDNG